MKIGMKLTKKLFSIWKSENNLNISSRIRVFFTVLLFINIILPAYPQTKKIYIPDIPGYKTLKCDFHMHTIYSDGTVWPNFRVVEAIRDGLDVIAVTDHLEFQAFPEIINKDYNKPYEIAKEEAAKKNNLIVIRGIEISPTIPPYHNNAIFLKDVNKLPVDYMKQTQKKFVLKDNVKKEELMAPFLEAQKQGAFVFYNHPAYFTWLNIKERDLFTSFHQDLYKKGILKGVEVVNGSYNIDAHRMAEKYNLTMFGNSDVHGDLLGYKDSHRPMTLVFVKEKTEESIKEALLARKTAVYVNDYIIARRPEAEALFKACISTTMAKMEKSVGNREPFMKITLENKSDIKFNLRVSADYSIKPYPLGQLVLMPYEKKDVVVGGLWNNPAKVELTVDAYNILISPDKNLQTVFSLNAF
ncbi:MAG: Sb-PDE family phosphodiesterase [Porphyromonadaceae bacterium]|nr:Sb-PDE family phosphodiesterase [Porphyromonadaceae bacterium]